MHHESLQHQNKKRRYKGMGYLKVFYYSLVSNDWMLDGIFKVIDDKISVEVVSMFLRYEALGLEYKIEFTEGGE
jgi:hypothetical protein